MLNLLVTLLIILIVIGVLWYIMGLLPIPQPIKNIALAIIGLIFVIWLLGIAFGGLPSINIR
jgi:membrane protein YdbS with pleckstrin-like domain